MTVIFIEVVGSFFSPYGEDVTTNCLFVKYHSVIYKLVISSDGTEEWTSDRKKTQNKSLGRSEFFPSGLKGKNSLGEDVVGLLLHQHGHVLNITTPQVQLLLHTFDLKQRPTGESQTGLCSPDEVLPTWSPLACTFRSLIHILWSHYIVADECNYFRTNIKWELTCCRSSTRGCTQVICTFRSTSSMLPLIRPTDKAFMTRSSTCRKQRASETILK